MPGWMFPVIALLASIALTFVVYLLVSAGGSETPEQEED